jgi:hypothetical protein
MASASASESAESLFLKANGLFQRGLDSTGSEKADRLQESASLYERIIDKNGIRNGHLYYNLGNCYFHLGQIGKAILNYRRAAKLIPNSADLRRNLKSARARRKDDIPKSQISSITRTLFFWHYVMSLRAKIVVFSLLFSMIWIVLLIKLFYDRPLVKWASALSILFAVVFGTSVAVETYKERSVRFGVILSGETVPRKGPGESYSPSFKEPLHEGTEFRLRERQGAWLQAELENGAICWIAARHVGTI